MIPLALPLPRHTRISTVARLFAVPFRALFCAVLLSSTLASARNWYVAPWGSNANSGLYEYEPVRTLQYAADRTIPGDVVRIMGGTHVESPSDGREMLNITRSGTQQQRIRYVVNNPDTPALVVFDGYYGIRVAANYIDVEGLRVRGNSANLTLADAQAHADGLYFGTGGFDAKFDGDAIIVTGTSTVGIHDVNIRGCEAWLAPGSGIAVQYADYVTIEDNNVHENCFYTPFGKSGINLFQLKSYGTATGVKVNVRRNRSWGNELLVPWINANNGPAITDGNGIIVDELNQSGYNGIVRIENNLVYRNGGRGINLTQSPRVEVFHNTSFVNALSSSISSEFVSGNNSNNTKVYNNIFWARSNKAVRTSPSSTGVDFRNNIVFGGTTGALFPGEKNMNPNMQNASALQFDLTASSPAINAGYNAAGVTTTDYDGNNRGTVRDIGAYEY